MNDQAELTAEQRLPTDEEPGFQAFFGAHYDRLARAMFLLCGNAGEAEDLAQEAMVRVFERWSRVEAMSSPEGYLYRTALNLHRSRLRRLATRRRKAEPSPSASAAADPADAAVAGDEVARALAALPDGQREAVVLMTWLGFSDAEAGRVLGIEPVSVRARVSRARAAMRNHLQIDDDGATDV